MEQGQKSSDDLRVWTCLSRSGSQGEALEVKLSVMNSQQSRDLEACPRKCKAANVELSRILYGKDNV